MDNLTRLLMQGAAGAAGDATYVDDVFSTLLWSGEFSGNAGTTRQMTNGVDLAGEGGLVWIKQRNQAYSTGHQLYDTERGAGAEKELDSSSNAIQGAGNIETYGWLNSFDAGGFTTKGGSTDSDYVNQIGVNYTGWTFRKAPGFFDVVTYTGNGSNRTIAHSLGSVPGMIMIKNVSSSENWRVYHRATKATHNLQLNDTDAAGASSTPFNNTEPTASVFSVGTDGATNNNGDTIVAYLFAGGNGTTDKAVEFDGTNDYLTVASSSDLTMGTGDFTVECWLTKDAQTHKGVWHISNATTGLDTNYGQTIALGYQSGVWQIYAGNSYQNSASYPIVPNKWYHAAYVRSGGTARLYINGEQVISMSDTVNYANTYMAIGGYYSTGYLHNGKISNLRVVKGQALYTSNFNVPHDPYTTTSNGAYSGNVKLLCCNGSTTTASTITPATITATGNPTVTTNNSIFDDTKANVFGEEGDQNIIKTGSYTGNGSSTGPEIYLGFEPQWVLFKNASSTYDWRLYDSMRGIVTGENDSRLMPNLSNAEETTYDKFDLTPTGFKIVTTNADMNENGSTITYIAIRRSDGYVGKPAEAGTEVFGIAYGAADSDTPQFRTPAVDVNDFTFYFQPAQNGGRYCGARLLQAKFWYTDTNGTPAGDSNSMYDYMDGFGSWTSNGTSFLNYAWKRHAGFDVVTYKGNGTAGHSISHSLNKTPEMIWVKNRTSSGNTGDWMVGHKDLNGGSSPWNEYLVLNKTQGEYSDNHPFNNYTPSSLDFQVNNWDRVNGNGSNYIAMLFASVEGVSKVGSFTGTGATITITTGFRPRFLILRASSMASPWYAFDTTRGWGAGNDQFINLNEATSQASFNFGEPTATGFTITDTHATRNGSGQNIIYYAHA